VGLYDHGVRKSIQHRLDGIDVAGIFDEPAAVGLIDADQPVATLVFPAFSTITAILTITDSAGHTQSASVKIPGAFAAASGTGALDPLTLALLAMAAAWQVMRRHRRLN